MKKHIILLICVSSALSASDSDIISVENLSSSYEKNIHLFEFYQNNATILNDIKENDRSYFPNYLIKNHSELTGNEIQQLKIKLTTYWQEQVDIFKEKNDFSQNEEKDEYYNCKNGCLSICLTGTFVGTVGGTITLALAMTNALTHTPVIIGLSTLGSISCICGLPQLIKCCCVTTKKRNAYNAHQDIKLMKQALKKLQEEV